MKLALLANRSCVGSRPFHVAKPRTERKRQTSSRRSSAQDFVQGTYPLHRASMMACSLSEYIQQFTSPDRKYHDIRSRSVAPEIDTCATLLQPPQIPFRSDRRSDRMTR